MDVHSAITSFAFDHAEAPVSLYEYAPVFRIRDRLGDWVLKRTGLVHSSGTAIGERLTALRQLGVDVVAPAAHLEPNPCGLANGEEWVVYPFINGASYRGEADQIANAGRLLGRIHSADLPEAYQLVAHDGPLVRPVEWVERHLALATATMRGLGLDPSNLETLVADRIAKVAPVSGLPLAGCCCDFKASNLVFGPLPTLVDPDHAALMPRLCDLAVALLLFHCDVPTAPDHVWTNTQWRTFLDAYREEVTFEPIEQANWASILNLAWLDQAVWLLGNWPEGWADDKERRYLTDLAALDLNRFSLS